MLESSKEPFCACLKLVMCVHQKIKSLQSQHNLNTHFLKLTLAPKGKLFGQLTVYALSALVPLLRLSQHLAFYFASSPEFPRKNSVCIKFLVFKVVGSDLKVLALKCSKREGGKEKTKT